MEEAPSSSSNAAKTFLLPMMAMMRA
jgi:hypothetical protein